MNDLPADDSRRKAVLAAVLAVQRGLVSPDEAVSVIAQLGGQAQQSLLSIAPGNVAAEIADEAEKLAADPEAAGSVLSEMGITPESQSTLFTFDPKAESEAATRVLRTMLETARTTGLPDQVKAVSARLPKAGGSGRYTIQREYARGGMGRILIALDNAVGREVALKELLPMGSGSTAGAGTSSSGLLERFLREAKVTGQLEHPNIVPVYEIAARDDGSVFYTMKLVRGKTMAHRLQNIQRDGALTDQQKLAQRLQLLDAFTDVCNAIAYAHSRGVIHRDLKPANIMLGDFGETLVLDWGLARVQGQEEKTVERKGVMAFSPSLLQDDSSARTLDGAVLGTPAYMPPEQAKGELDKVDEKSDVYALGAILYEILSGRPPFEGSNAQTVLARVLVLEPEPLRQVAPLAPPDLVSLADKAMARDRARRLESAQALAREVAAFRDGRNLSVYRYSRTELLRRFVRRNRAPVAVAAVALLLMLGGAAYSFQNIMHERDQVRLSLEAAEREREGRIALEQRQLHERERLIAARHTEISDQRHRLDNLRAANLVAEASRRVTELDARVAGGGVLSPSDRAENSRITSGLLAAAAAREELLRLLTAPVAGRSHEFVPAAVLAEDRASLRETRLKAAEIALLNEDFALAEFVVEGTDAEDRAQWLRRISAGRTALLTRHRLAIEAALDDVRKGLARKERPRGNIRLDDYVLQLSAYRELQTVELLVAALAPFAAKARDPDPDLLWTQPERDEVTLLCRVLGYLELPDRTVPPLAAFLADIRDTRLAVEAASALCQTAHETAYQPLVAARARFGTRSYVWSLVVRNFNRVPEPRNLPEPATAAQYLDRAAIRADQGLTQLVAADRERAYQLEPRNPRAIAGRGAALGNSPEALEMFDLAISLDPTYARAWSLRGSLLMNRGRREQAYIDMATAIALDPDDEWLWHIRGYLNNVHLRDFESGAEDYTRMIELAPYSAVAFANRASAYFELRKFELAIGDATRAIELNPYHPEAWNNRAAARSQLGDIEGAIEDLTRMLEVSPGHLWANINRASNRMKLGQYKGALYDLDRVLEKPTAFLPHAWRMRAECHEALGDKASALADYHEYLKRTPNATDAEEVKARIKRLESE